MFEQIKQGFNFCIEHVDVVTVSTKRLAKEVRNHVKTLRSKITGKEIPIIVCENYIDPTLFVRPESSDHDIVGWAGSSSHVGDLEMIQDVLVDCTKEYPDIEFQFRGCDPPPKLAKIKNVKHKIWATVPEFGARMPLWGWTIALAPVTDHTFNNSKSCIKMMESAYCRVPCLASYIEPYEYFCSHDPELKYLLCAGPSAFKTKIRELLNEPARRLDLGNRMHKVLREHFTFNAGHPGWDKVFETLKTL
jgi:glycosyltransferase involved in cell wall biosynthesis